LAYLKSIIDTASPPVPAFAVARSAYFITLLIGQASTPPLLNLNSLFASSPRLISASFPTAAVPIYLAAVKTHAATVNGLAGA
jgi:hypothetical protein